MRGKLCVLVLLIVVGLCPSSTAQTGRKATDKFLHDYFAAYNPKDAAKLGDFYAEDATFTDPSFGLDLKGKKSIGSLLTTALAKYDTLEHQLLHTVRNGNEVVVEGLMVASLRGKSLKVHYVSVFTLEKGKIKSQRDLYDLLHFFEQLGVTPPQFRK